jgi:hypothetical protein
MYVKEIGHECVGWIHLAQNLGKLQAFVNTVMNSQVLDVAVVAKNIPFQLSCETLVAHPLSLTDAR